MANGDDLISVGRARGTASRRRSRNALSVVGPVYPIEPSYAGTSKSLLRRDPKVDRREGRNWEILVEMINSLLQGGYIYEVRTDADLATQWRIAAEGITTGLTGTFGDSGTVSGLTGTFDSGSFGTG